MLKVEHYTSSLNLLHRFETSFILLYICCSQIGGGSLRIYRRAVQEKVLSAIGLTPEEVCIST